LSAGAGAAQRYFMRRVLPQLAEKEHPKTTPCSQCGKLIPVEDAVTWGEKRLLCSECYGKLSLPKRIR
jgi:formylmethanofuran dehydrogenase subunit E